MNKYCVYLHKLDDKVVYVGSGTYKRSKSKDKRSKEHLEVFDKIKVEIVKDNLTKEDSLNLEQELINLYSAKYRLFNRTLIVSKVIHIEYEDISKYFYYDDTSPSGLRWKIGRGGTVVGQVAGSTNSEKYYQVKLYGKNLKCHRIVYCLCNKVDLSRSHVIDHIDGNKCNNNISNLRQVTQSENNKNRKHKDSNSGLRSISHRPKELTYVVRWVIEGKRYSKCFSYSKSGYKSNPLAFFDQELALSNAVLFRDQLVADGIILSKE